MRGFIALISVLIISAIAVLLAISASQLSIGKLKMSSQQNQSSKSYYWAQACAEEALLKLKNNLSYTGNETLTVDGETCNILPLEGSGENRVIKVQSNAFNQTRKIRIETADINPEVVILSWREVADF